VPANSQRGEDVSPLLFFPFTVYGAPTMANGDRRTFLDYQNEVLNALGNPDPASLSIAPSTIVNDAIEYIVSMNEWNWISTGQQSLDIIADQDHVTLPADFGTLQAIEFQQSWAEIMTPVNWETLLWLRQNPLEAWTSGYFYTIATGNVEVGQEDAGLTLATIAIYPTPAADDLDAIQVVYRRFIRRLVNNSDRPQWPPYMDRLGSLLARSYAMTDYDDNASNAYQQQFQVEVADALNKDGAAVKSFGIPAGAVSSLRRLTPFGYPDNGIPDPTNFSNF